MDTGRSGPWQLVEQLHRWARSTDWCRWLELAGSLGRGSGDELSDVDAGIGVDDSIAFTVARDRTLAAARAFAPVADHLVQTLGPSTEPADHLVIQYRDGRQLSLVVWPSHHRPGLPPGAQALMDRDGRLSEPWTPGSFTATRDQQREWAFLAWWALADVAKHATRGKLWRAVGALEEARGYAWKLHAASLAVEYPTFGAVSVENADLPAPGGIAESLPTRVERTAILDAARALAMVLESQTDDLDVSGIGGTTRSRLTFVGAGEQPG